MGENTQSYTWDVLGQSVRGAAHVRKDAPNQDSIDWYPNDSVVFGPPLVLVVADGHGGAESFRSESGANLATRTTISLIRDELFKNDLMDGDLFQTKQLLDAGLPRDLVLAWTQAVEAHLQEVPLQEPELAVLKEKVSARACKKVEAYPQTAYGATLLVVLITTAFIYILQLGDGDILTVSDNGEVGRPLPGDERLIANETTSLAQEKAWNEFRCAFIPLVDRPPALILVSSDGYANAFLDEENFCTVGKDLLDLICDENGPQFVQRNLEGWLNEASLSGSGDDISLGIIYRRDIVGSAVTIEPPSIAQPGVEGCSEEPTGVINDNVTDE